MTLLKPLGLISLISLLVLLIIYIIKQNYQQKFVSSTFVWKLSLKKKKRKLPINKLRNILLIICQILILLLLSAVIAKPVKVVKADNENEVILILDTSASMRTMYEDETRFERAINLMKEKVNETWNAEGVVTIVIAAKKPYFLVERATIQNRWDVDKQINDFIYDDNGKVNCSYGSSSLDDATALCTDIVQDNPTAKIYIYTDVDVEVTAGINVVNVANKREYNVAILRATSEIIDNYYSYQVDLACYGRNATVGLAIDVYAANVSDDNPKGSDYTFETNVDLDSDLTRRVIFINANTTIDETDESVVYVQIPEGQFIYSYESVHVMIDVEDSFFEDNVYDIYGGTKEPLRVLYATSLSNPFFIGALITMKNAFSDRFDVQIVECKDNNVPYNGFDLYIYEHEKMPERTPTDGVVIFADPLADVTGAGFRLQSILRLNGSGLALSETNYHPILNNMNADNVTVSQFTSCGNIDQDYEVLWSIDNYPAIMMRDVDDTKTIVMLFSLHYSNLPITIEFPLFIYNIFDYFMPATLTGNEFEVDDDLQVRSRGPEVEIVSNSSDDLKYVVDSFPGTVSLTLPGTYTISQTTYFGMNIKEEVYVKIPEAESNIFRTIDSVINPTPFVNVNDSYIDPLFWLAVGLASLVFVEWLLKGSDTL